MKIGFVINEDKDKNFEYTKKLIEFVISKEVEPLLFENIKEKINMKNVTYLEEKQLFKQSKFIVILGGDGTILNWSIKICHYNKSILGINMGNLGYLADVEKQDGFLAIEKLLSNDYKVEKRMMLNVEINGKNYKALNEVNINNGSVSRMIKIGIDINGEFVEALNADGLIISTPTGSTAYNLSAGGPILKPDTQLMAITYVCPHVIFSRPYIISSEDKIKAYLAVEDAKGFISLDGQNSIPIKYGDSIYIEKSSYYTNIIKTNQLNFYDILREKMFGIRK